MWVHRIAAVGAAVLGAAALVATLGFASSLPSATKKLGASSVAVARCDTDGVTILQNLSGANVASVTVGGIASACGGATLSLTFNNGTTSSSGSGAVPAGGGSMTVTLAVAVALKDSGRIDVAIAGP
jgi:hypothetical protein